MALLASADHLGDERYSHQQIASVISPKVQQLIILPTEKCNFRCTYCYEDFQIGRMKEAVQISIERFLAHRVPGLSHLAIDWFGGEPLVAKSVVLRLSSYASRLCKQHEVTLAGGMTTNGYLLDPELFSELLSYDQRFYQITFDGWQDGHDVLRKLANGKGTFERIWQNVLATKRSEENFTIQFRIHVRRDNLASIETLIDQIAREFGNDNRYILDFEHLRNLGGEGGKTVDRPFSREEVGEIEAGLRARFRDVASSSVELRTERPAENQSSNAEASWAQPYICYAAKPNSLLIRADGRIGKCTVALTDDRNTIGALNADGTVQIDNERLRPWVRGLSTLDERALECPLGGMARASLA